jgi:hypothetical protein
MPYPLTIFGNPPLRATERDLLHNIVAAGSYARAETYFFPFSSVLVLLQGGYVARSGTRDYVPTEKGREYDAKHGRRRNPRVRANPPRRGRPIQQSKRVYEIAYKHVADGKDYKHKFASGVCMELLGDGSVRLYRMDGRPLFKNFPD